MERLAVVCDAHQEKHGKLPAHHKKLFKYGILQVQMALQNSLRSAMITKSFASAGVYPYDPLTIFRNCQTHVGDSMLRSIMDKLPMLTKKLLSQGELFDEDFINAGICVYGGEAMKNSLVIYRYGTTQV